MADKVTDDYGAPAPSFPVAIDEAAQAMYSTYCGLMNSRGLMPTWHDLHGKLKANWLRLAESGFESFKRSGLCR